jgi:fructokinase
MIAGIETGGTKVICAVSPTNSTVEQAVMTWIDTTTPEETLGKIREFLELHGGDAPYDAVGLASFGPLDVNTSSERFGWITSTPKAGWRNTDLLSGLGLHPSPVAVVTDVTGAAVGEQQAGAGEGVKDLAYVTVGTGVGAGLIVGGKPLSGQRHPELGHLTVRRHPKDKFPGLCPFHGDCLEGLASGPAVAGRWGRPGRQLGPDLGQEVEISSYYIAQLMAAITYTVAPERIVFGGGVSKTPGLLHAVRTKLEALVGGALDGHVLASPGDGYIVPPALGDYSGVQGALALARQLSPSRLHSIP